MNRSIIDEDAEFEILGVVEFIDTKSWKGYGNTFRYDMLSYLKTKIHKHLNFASGVMMRSFGAQNLDTHLIVGLPIPHIWGHPRGESLWTERSRYCSHYLPLLVAKSITSVYQSNVISNELGELLSYTVLNEWKYRTIKKWEIKRQEVKYLDQASYGRPNLEMTNVNQANLEQTSVKPVQTIYQDVDGFYEHLSRFEYQRLDRCQGLQPLLHPLQQWREGFRRFKLKSEIKIEEEDGEIGESFLAAEALSDEPLVQSLSPKPLDFDDNSSEYIEYLGNRFTYY